MVMRIRIGQHKDMLLADVQVIRRRAVTIGTPRRPDTSQRIKIIGRLRIAAIINRVAVIAVAAVI